MPIDCPTCNKLGEAACPEHTQLFGPNPTLRVARRVLEFYVSEKADVSVRIEHVEGPSFEPGIVRKIIIDVFSDS